MVAFPDLVAETTATIGTGTLTLGGALSTGFFRFQEKLADGTTVHYKLTEGGDVELGEGVYSAGTLTRATVFSSRIGGVAGTAKINLVGGGTVFAVAVGADLAASILTTRGDVLRRGAAGIERLALGAAGTVLSSDGTDVVYRTLSALLDAVFGSTRGMMLRRGAAAWEAVAKGSTNTVLAAGANDPAWSTLTSLLDAVFGATRGMILYRGASAWAALAGDSGKFLRSAGSGGDPAWSSAIADAINARIGTWFLHPAATPPTGALKRNGAAVAIATYPELAAVIYCGDANNPTADWGYKTTSQASPSANRSTAGQYIVLPDARGRFDRGYDDGAGVDSGRTLWSYQSDAIRNITGALPQTWRNTSGAASGAFAETDGADNKASPGSSFSSATWDFDASRVVPTAAENRPTNIAGLPCIWYQGIV